MKLDNLLVNQYIGVGFRLPWVFYSDNCCLEFFLRFWPLNPYWFWFVPWLFFGLLIEDGGHGRALELIAIKILDYVLSLTISSLGVLSILIHIFISELDLKKKKTVRLRKNVTNWIQSFDCQSAITIIFLHVRRWSKI